jgi:hypothetical protein
MNALYRVILWGASFAAVFAGYSWLYRALDLSHGGIQ